MSQCRAKPVKPIAYHPVAGAPRVPTSVTRIPTIEKQVDLGLQLLELRRTIAHNATFGHQVRRRFDVDAKQAHQAMSVARAYGSRPEIFTRLSWISLVALSSATLAVKGCQSPRMKR
jgi:hypothetical protein